MPLDHRRRRDPSSGGVVVTDLLGPWADAWDRLLDEQASPSPFLRSWWLDAVAEGEPVTVLVVEGDELWGGAALQRDRVAGVERLRFRGAGPLQPDHLDLVARADRTHEVLAAVTRWLGRPGDRLIDLDGLDANAWLLDAVPGRGPVRVVESAPYVSLPDSLDTYLAGRPSRMRNTIRRTAKRLDAAGVETRRVAADDWERGLADLRRLHDTRWGEASGFLDRWEPFAAAIRAGASRGEVLLTELVHPDDGVIASEVELLVGRRVSFYQAGRSTDRRWRGAGSVLRVRILGDAVAAGCQEFDLLRGGEGYKSEWADGTRPVHRVRRGVGARGVLLATALELNRRRAERADRRRAAGGEGPVRLVVYSDAQQLGGAERQTMQLLAGLADRFAVTVVGVDAEVVAALASARPGVDTRVLAPVRGKADLGAVLAHRRVLRQLRPAIVHAQLGHGSSCQYAMLAALSVPGTKVIATEHSPMGVWSRSSRAIKRRMLPRLAAHVAVGRRAAELVAADVGIDATSLRVIPNGVAPLAIEPFDRPVEAPTVGVVARFDPVKGVDVAIEAIARLAGVHLVVVGDGPLREAVEAQVGRLGIGDRVHLVGWAAEPRAWLPAFDVVVLPSRLEGMPVSVIEAMLAGRAVVATDVGSVRELVLDGETGLVVPPEDPDALAAAIDRLLADPDRRAAMGLAGRTRAEAHFTSAAVVTAYEALYDEVLGRSGGSGG